MNQDDQIPQDDMPQSQPDQQPEPEEIKLSETEEFPSGQESEPEPEKNSELEPEPAAKHVLPPKKYKLKTALLFTDFFAIIVYVYYLMIRVIIKDMAGEEFSFASNRMFAFYCVLAITLVGAAFILIFKFTKSAKTRYERANEVRQNPNIKVWLIGFDWGWPILFLPTMVLMFAAGLIGVLLNLVMPESQALGTIQDVIGGIVLVVGTLNAAVVIFKLKPVVLALITGSFLVILLIMLLHGPQTFLGFFKGFRYLGIDIEPLGYILLGYVWSVFLRIIWFKSLFSYWVFLPNRLELQHGLSESNDSVDRDDLRHQIDTDDVILRWWNVGIITYYFPEMDRLPITNVVWGIRKKAIFANRIASIKSMSD